MLKRLLDVVLSAGILLAFVPVWLAIALAIKLDSDGPVFYTTEVVGQGFRKFVIYKFRTMVVGANDVSHNQAIAANILQRRPAAIDSKGRPIFKTAVSDPRKITRVGRFLRRTSLDEVPQLWNVLRGDMSLVGPRPALPFEAQLYDEWQSQRFRVPPGITGLYQVTARNRVPLAEMLALDVAYASRPSLLLDLKIILKTPLHMLRGI